MSPRHWSIAGPATRSWRMRPRISSPAKAARTLRWAVSRSCRCRAPTDNLRPILFDDQMRLHLDREGHIRQSGDAGELGRHLGVIDLEEIGHVALGKLNGFQNGSELF